MPRPKLQRNLTKARELRRAMSLPEVLLWNQLRKNPDDIHFRRQHPLGPFVLDYYCAAARTAFEIDGISHEIGNRPDRDEARDQWLQTHGIRVVRIPASDVLHSPEAVADGIVRFCKG